MMFSTTTLTAVLVVAAISSLAALAMTVVALVDTRRDLRYVEERGIGNGRRAAAKGEHLLAWTRLGQAIVSLILTSLLIYIATAQVGLGSKVSALWVVVVGLVAGAGMGVTFQAAAASRIRRRVLHLGIVDPNRRESDRHSPPKDQQ